MGAIAGPVISENNERCLVRVDLAALLSGA